MGSEGKQGPRRERKMKGEEKEERQRGGKRKMKNEKERRGETRRGGLLQGVVCFMFSFLKNFPRGPVLDIP